MTDDWRDKIAKHRASKEAREQKEHEDDETGRIKALGDLYHCHLCGERATKPGTKVIWRKGLYRPYQTIVDDWSKPAFSDLFECEMCGQWTCHTCGEDGICRECGEKL